MKHRAVPLGTRWIKAIENDVNLDRPYDSFWFYLGMLILKTSIFQTYCTCSWTIITIQCKIHSLYHSCRNSSGTPRIRGFDIAVGQCKECKRIYWALVRVKKWIQSNC